MFILEEAEMQHEEVWDSWFKGCFPSKEKLEARLEVFKQFDFEHHFRVLEINEQNDVLNGWVVTTGKGRIDWRDIGKDCVRLYSLEI